MDPEKKFKPTILKVEKEKGFKVDDCFPNVLKKVKKDGGSAQYGWQIWESKHYIEAEFHCVWKDKRNAFRDFTPKSGGDKQIMFIPIDNKKWEMEVVPSKRISICDNEIVDCLLSVLAKRDIAYQKTSRANPNGTEGFMALEMQEMFLECQQLLQSMLILNKESGDNCLCGSGKIFKTCHLPIIEMCMSDVVFRIEKLCKAVKEGKVNL